MAKLIESRKKNLRHRQAFSMPRLARVLLLTVALVLLAGNRSSDRVLASPLLLASGQDRAAPLESAKSVAEPGHSQQMSHSKQNINVLEDLIFRAIDDMGDRLKKNKLHSIKQTLRFGRSDPSMAPTSSHDEDLDDAPNDVRPMDLFADYDRNYH